MASQVARRGATHLAVANDICILSSLRRRYKETISFSITDQHLMLGVVLHVRLGLLPLKFQ